MVIVAPTVPTEFVDCTTTDPPPPPPGEVGELPPHAVITINAAMLAAARIRLPRVTVHSSRLADGGQAGGLR
jgi:hypothetical protein